jgi:hypothetical protein
VQPQRDLRDQPERPVGAGHQLGQVVARDVLDHLPARARDRPIGQCDGDAQHQVARPAVPVAQRPRIARGHDPADGRVVTRRIEGEHLPGLGERLPQLPQGHPGLNHSGQVAGVVLDDQVEVTRGQG